MTERYLPLYRKYRPQTFLDLIGQENIVKAFSNAIKLGKIAHAYLLCGPRGTGKTSSARILAKSLNCEQGPTLTPCGKCPSCLDIINSNPIDVIEIDAASNRKVEDARNILEKIQFVPVHGRYKIYIIDEVHMLTTEAFNTLLKTLEEPPENVIFILATTEPHKVLDTIISRCQRFDFRRITNDDIVKRLKYISEQENINISDEALNTIARSSAGGMRDSLALLDQISVADTEKQISPDDVNELLGRLSYDVLFEIGSCILNSDTQNSLVVKNCTDLNIAIELTQLSEQNIKKLKEQAQNIEIEQMIYIIERLSFYSKEIKETTNRYLWLELCIMELSSNTKYASFAQLIERVERLEAGSSQPMPAVMSSAPVKYNRIADAPQQIKEQKTAPAVQKTKISDENPAPPEIKEPREVIHEEREEAVESALQHAPSGDTAANWQGVLQNIESVPSRMFFYNLSKPVTITPEEITVVFGKDIFVRQAKEESKLMPLKKAALAFFSVPDIKITIRLGSHEEMEAAKPVVNFEKKNEVKSVRTQADEEKENAEYLEETLKPKEKKISPADYSDQAKMILDVFNGKIID